MAAARKATMDFTDTTHDFGKVHEKEVVEHDFVFTNNGKSPLIINSATGSCGCSELSTYDDGDELSELVVHEVGTLVFLFTLHLFRRMIV